LKRTEEVEEEGVEVEEEGVGMAGVGMEEEDMDIKYH
jgi:hypothetical protein